MKCLLKYIVLHTYIQCNARHNTWIVIWKQPQACRKADQIVCESEESSTSNKVLGSGIDISVFTFLSWALRVAWKSGAGDGSRDSSVFGVLPWPQSTITSVVPKDLSQFPRRGPRSLGVWQAAAKRAEQA